MPHLTPNLVLDRCPHCAVATPNLDRKHHLQTNDHTGNRQRFWSIYVCTRCGGVVSAWANADGQPVQEWFPTTEAVSEDLPEKPRAFLQQAKDSLSRVGTGDPYSRALFRHLCALAPFLRQMSSVGGRPLSSWHRQRPDPPPHVAEQPPGASSLKVTNCLPGSIITESSMRC